MRKGVSRGALAQIERQRHVERSGSRVSLSVSGGLSVSDMGGPMLMGGDSPRDRS